jgi:hypothetical protein
LGQASVDMEDAGKPTGEAHVMQKLIEEHRSKSKIFDLST